METNDVLDRTHEDTWATYTASWKTDDPAERSRLFAASLADDCVYTDPLTQAEGWAELAAYMEQFHQQIPGGHFVTTAIEGHHDRVLVTWDMVSGAGDKIGKGTSYGTFGDDGRLTSMTGFFATDT
ncbi:MAG: nuclear transport factor 2 family protein [Acidimicrobiales bacterium]